MFCLFPRNFIIVTGSVLKIVMDIHWAFTYTQNKFCIDTLTTLLFVMSEVMTDLVHRKRSTQTI